MDPSDPHAPSHRYTRRTSEWIPHGIVYKQNVLHTYCKSYVKHCLLWIEEQRAEVCVADVTFVLRDWAD